MKKSPAYSPLFVALSVVLSAVPPSAFAQAVSHPLGAAALLRLAPASGPAFGPSLGDAPAPLPSAAIPASAPSAADWIPVLVKLDAAPDSAGAQDALRALQAHGFNQNPAPIQQIAPGVYAVSGVAPARALGAIAEENIPGVAGVMDLTKVERARRAANNLLAAPDWDALMKKSGDLAAERSSLLARRQAVQVRHYAHVVHALQNEKSYDAASGEWVHPNVLAVQTKSALAKIDARLERLAAEARAHQEAVLDYRVRLGASAMTRVALLDPAAWTAPVGTGDVVPKGTPAEPGVPPVSVKGVPAAQWQWFFAHGFDLSSEPNQVARVSGRWTGREVDYARLGLSFSAAGFAKSSAALTREDALRWLQVAEMSAAGAVPAAAVFTAEQSQAAEAGRKLLSWGVPPHVLDNSQDVVSAVSPSGDKIHVSISPDAKFYSFAQGVPVATQTGAMLVQFLEKLERERPGQAKLLTPIELQSLAYLIDKQAKPWWAFDPQGAEKLMDQLYQMLRDGKIIKPLVDEPLGIDVAAPALDLAGHLGGRYGALQSRLAAAALGETSLSDLHSLALAARFAWTQLAAPTDAASAFRTIAHDDGLAFLQHTGWERAREIWRLMPLGETVLQLGLDPILRYAIENDVQGDPLAVADAGWVDVFHPDVAKARLIFRDGAEVSADQFFIPPAPPAADAPAEAAAKLPQPKIGPLRKGAEASRIDSHATAIAGLLGLAATALHTKLVSIDLPGFSGDQDAVPPGVNSDDFFLQELSRSMISAMEKWGVRFFNFSWGGGLGGKSLHAFLDKMSERGAKIFVALGNSGPGFAQETAPSFASSVYNIGALDGLGSRSGFTSGGGFLLAEDGKIVFAPYAATLGGAVLPNSRLTRIPENPDASILFLFSPAGDFIHIRGTSFASPLAMTILSLLNGVTRHKIGAALKAQGLSADETARRLLALQPRIDAAVKDAVAETAQMPPGVSAIYAGQGAIRPAAALARLTEQVPVLAAPQSR